MQSNIYALRNTLLWAQNQLDIIAIAFPRPYVAYDSRYYFIENIIWRYK